MSAICVAEKMTILLDTLALEPQQRITMLEAISDLRAAFCSFCNKTLYKGVSGAIDATEVGRDVLKNRIFKCTVCSNSGK
jgi:hypothetical protein